LLDLFTLDEPAWTMERLMIRLGLSKTTAYRYVKELQEAGFLSSGPGNELILGPRFIEFDRQIRLADPLLQIAPSILAPMREEVAGAIVVCRFYGDRVLAVLQDRLDPKIPLQMERGRPFPLFFGAPSRIILAYLPPYQQRNLLLHYPQEIASAGLGETWPQFKEILKTIRRAGYYTSSDLNPHIVGVATPIFSAPNAVSGSVCLVRMKSKAGPKIVSRLTELAIEAGRQISLQLEMSGHPRGRFAAKT
jgi:DNA-binding IclR family transcriptional regulator